MTPDLRIDIERVIVHIDGEVPGWAVADAVAAELRRAFAGRLPDGIDAGAVAGEAGMTVADAAHTPRGV